MYKIIQVPEKRKTICVDTYCGKTFTGIAKCSSNDKFDPEVGEKLARFRCKEKISYARMRYFQSEIDKAEKTFMEAKRKLSDLYDREHRVHAQYAKAKAELEDYLTRI